MKKRVCLLTTLLAIVIMGVAMSVEAAEIVDQGYCGGEARFISSPLFHEFVPKRRLTGARWFDYLGL